MIWAVGLGLAALCGAGLSVWMASAAYASPPLEENQYTVVVLGCQVIEDQPSLMLRRRLDAAFAYLTAHPEAPVVVSGGLDTGKKLSEAEVMRNYLINLGVSPERIYLEDRSYSTETNLSESAKIIDGNGLPRGVAIATDGFHLLRGRIYARKNGLSPQASLPARTPWGLRPGYWVREWFAIAKAEILD